MSKISREVEKNNQDWARSSGPRQMFNARFRKAGDAAA
jgi:hypothetical protein